MNILLFLSFFLSTVSLELGTKVIQVEIAKTREERHTGLMNRDSIPDDYGMLFVFESPDILTFWMKDTSIPLAIGFFDEHKVLIHWEEMTPAKGKLSLPIYESRKPAQYALEVPYDWFRKNKIIPGMKFSLKNASLDPSSEVK